MSDLVTRLRRKTIAGQPVFPSPIELEAADRIANLESQLATTTALLNAGAERIKELEAALRGLFDEIDSRFGSIADMSPELLDVMMQANAALQSIKEVE